LLSPLMAEHELPPSFHPSSTISEPELRRSMRINVAAGIFGMLWMVVPLGLPLPLLLRAVEASGWQLGLMSAAWQLAMLAQVPSAFIVERLNGRKTFWASVSIVHRLLWLVPAFLPWLLPNRPDLWPGWIIAALALSNLLGQAGTAPWQSWMADLLPADRAGRFWGSRHRWLSVALVCGALLYGRLLDRYSNTSGEYLGFQFVFGIAALAGVADIVLHCAVTEPKPVRHTSPGHLLERTLAPLRDRNFRRFTIAMGLWVAGQAMLGYTMGLPGFFSMVYVKEQFGATYGQASWIFVASALGAVLWTAMIGHWIDLWGARKVLLRLTIVGPVSMLTWLCVPAGTLSFGGQPLSLSIITVAVLSLLIGGFYSGTWVAQVRLTQALTAPAGRTVAMGVHWSAVGLIGSCGALFAGWVKDHLPSGWPGSILSNLAPWTYFQVLVILHVLLAWVIVRPMLKRLSSD
jgi:MFS family permease